MSARWSRSLAMVTAWEPASPTESRSDGFVGVGPLDVAVGAGQAQVLVEGLHRLDAEAHLLPDLVAHDDPQVAGGGEFAHAAPPGGQAGQGDADGFVPERHPAGTGTATGWGRPSRRSMVVWSSNRPARAPSTSWPRASRSSRVSSRKCRVERVPALRRPGRRWGWSSRCHSCGDGGLGQGGGAAGVYPVRSRRAALTTCLLDGPERDRGGADALGADQAADEGEPAAEDDRGPALGRLRGPGCPSRWPSGPNASGLIRAGRPGPIANGLHAEEPAQRFVLVLGVAQDQGAVAEVHHPQDERLGGGGLAAAGFAEADDVGVGDRDVVAQDPPERVGVERAPGQHVDAHLGAGGRQAGGGDERPQHRCLVRGHPPHRHRRRGSRRPSRARPARARVGARAGTAGAPAACGAGAGVVGRSWPKSASSRVTSRPGRSWRRSSPPRRRRARRSSGSGSRCPGLAVGFAVRRAGGGPGWRGCLEVGGLELGGLRCAGPRAEATQAVA